MEWNQPLSHRSAPFRRVGDRLMFELIQIGAVKLDEKRRMIGSFSQLITPEQYMKLHPRIRRITGIQQEDLAGMPGFREALERFLSWCGPDCALLTWGKDDISVLQQNLDFFKVKSKMPLFYDVQRLYSSLQEERGHKTGLKAAMAVYGILEHDEHPFHNAVDDAYYTGLVFQQLPEAEAVLNFPETPRELGKTRRGGRENEQTTPIRGERAFFSSAAGKRVTCPTCGSKVSVAEGYVPMRDAWQALADCKDHGLIFSEVVFSADENGKKFARVRTWLSDEQHPAYVQTKHLQWAGKLAALRRKEAKP